VAQDDASALARIQLVENPEGENYPIYIPMDVQMISDASFPNHMAPSRPMQEAGDAHREWAYPVPMQEAGDVHRERAYPVPMQEAGDVHRERAYPVPMQEAGGVHHERAYPVPMQEAGDVHHVQASRPPTRVQPVAQAYL